MGNYEERTFGFIAHKLDLIGLAELAKDYFKLVHGRTIAPDDYFAVEPIVIVKTSETGRWGTSRLATICSEGVGWVENQDSGLVSVMLNLSEFSMCDVAMELHPRVIARYITGEQVDLADWVRVFGGRLETNLNVWQGSMREVEQDFSGYLTKA